MNKRTSEFRINIDTRTTNVVTSAFSQDNERVFSRKNLSRNLSRLYKLCENVILYACHGAVHYKLCILVTHQLCSIIMTTKCGGCICEYFENVRRTTVLKIRLLRLQYNILYSVLKNGVGVNFLSLKSYEFYIVG